MKKFMAVLGGIVLIALGAVFFIAKKENNTDQHTSYSSHEKNSVSATEPQKNEPSKKNSEYLIKEYNGNIAVFENGEKAPFRTTCINVSELPEADRNLLKKGICASSREEMDAILEDYCS